MGSVNLKSAALVAMLAVCTIFGTGCYADAETEPVVADAIDPPPLRYYMGSEVYYDPIGRPYFYDGGAISYVPVGAARAYDDRFDGRAYGPPDFHEDRAPGRGSRGRGTHYHGSRGGWHVRR